MVQLVKPNDNYAYYEQFREEFELIEGGIEWWSRQKQDWDQRLFQDPKNDTLKELIDDVDNIIIRLQESLLFINKLIKDMGMAEEEIDGKS